MLWPEKAGEARLSERQGPDREPALDRILLATGRELLQPVLPNRLQHGKAGLAGDLIDLLQETFVDQRGDSLQRIDRRCVVDAERLSRGQGETTSEHGEPPEQRLFR